jgi:transposase
MSLRGTLRGFGLKVGKTTPSGRSRPSSRAMVRFEARILELVAGHPSLRVIAKALLAVRGGLLREFNAFEKRVRTMARCDTRARLLMSVPGVGPIVALTTLARPKGGRPSIAREDGRPPLWRAMDVRAFTPVFNGLCRERPYASGIDDPARFKSSKSVGAHFGLTPKKYQSGETDISGRISKIGDKGVRTASYQAAHVMLTRPVKGCSALKSWAMKLAKRAGMKKAKVALARKLAVIMHRMLADGTTFANA